MTEPIITLSNSATMNDVWVDSGVDKINMWYYLYADDSAFDNWTDWVNDSVNSPTQKNLDNASTYTNYVMKLKCKLVAANNACGFVSKDKGGIFIESNAEGEIVANADTRLVASNTFTFTHTQFGEWTTAWADAAPS